MCQNSGQRTQQGQSHTGTGTAPSVQHTGVARPQHTATAHGHSTRPEHTVTAHGHVHSTLSTAHGGRTATAHGPQHTATAPPDSTRSQHSTRPEQRTGAVATAQSQHSHSTVTAQSQHTAGAAYRHRSHRPPRDPVARGRGQGCAPRFCLEGGWGWGWVDWVGGWMEGSGEMRGI